MNKIAKVFNGLFNKFDTTEKRYEEALEKKQEELIAVGAELSEMQLKFKDLEKMFLLGDISESTYEAEKVMITQLQKRVQVIQNVMNLIKEYQTEDIQAVLAELEANRKEVNVERQAELKALEKEVLQAKYDYITKLIEAKDQYYELTGTDRKIEKLKEKLGMKNQSLYLSGSFEALSAPAIEGGDYLSLRVDQKELHDALHYGKFDIRLQKEVEK